MTWREILALPVVIVALTFLTGVGSLAWNVGKTWQPRNTDTLITGLVAACGGGMVVAGVLLGVVIGVPVMLRIMRESAAVRQDYLPRAQAVDGQWRQLPGDATPLPPPPQPVQPPMSVSLDAIDNDENFGEW